MSKLTYATLNGVMLSKQIMPSTAPWHYDKTCQCYWDSV